MATTKQPIDIDQYNTLADTVKKSLSKSKTAYTQGVAPTTSDLRDQLNLMSLRDQIAKANDEKLKKQLYGDQPKQTTDLNNLAPRKSSFITKTLDALATPLYAVVGAVEAATGKGTKPGFQNIRENIKERETFGSLLQKFGVGSKWVSMPLGFAMDVALDPVNWLTAGTTAALPKLAVGLKRGGLEGLAAAGKAAAVQKANTTSKFVPFLGKNLRTALGDAASVAEDTFRGAANLPSVAEQAVQTSQRTKLSDIARAWFNNGEDTSVKKRLSDFLSDKFKYSPEEEFNLSKSIDEKVAQQFATGERMTLDDFLEQARGDVNFAADPVSAEIGTLARGEDLAQLRHSIVDPILNPPARGSLEHATSAQVQSGLSQASDAVEQVRQKLADEIRANRTETGVQFYDNLVTKVNKNKYASQVFKFFDLVNGVFKFAKVPVNFGSYTNSVVSNTVMAGMMGINFLEPTYLRSLKEGFRVANGKQLGEIAGNISDETLQWLRKYRTVANDDLNFNVGMLEKSMNAKLLAQIAEEGRDIFSNAATAVYGKDSPELVQRQLGLWEKIRQMFTGNKQIEEMTPFIKDEVFFGEFGRIMRNWEQSGIKNPGTLKSAVVDLVKRASENYGKIDQTFKIGTFLHLTSNGISGDELQRIARFIKFAPEDIRKVGNMYRLSPEAAGRVANEAYMNYAAMPAFIRVIRGMPLLGSPFASFSYAMLSKAGKTAVQNPSIYNKVTFGRSEINSGNPQTPLEKAALGGPYYNYLNRYERMKLPFMQEYPLYLNIANWVPYLGMNIFQEPERKYSNWLTGTVDQLPFLKTPEGQVLFDYVIQPFILNEAQPTGMFGQPLYREGDTALDKTGRATRALVESYAPTLTPFVGYRAKQLANAAQGKTAQGTLSSDSKGALLLRGLLGTVGVGVSDLDLNDVTYDIKKQLGDTKESKKSTK